MSQRLIPRKYLLATTAIILCCVFLLVNARSAHALPYVVLSTSAASSDQLNPKIYENRVVWEDWRNNSALLYPGCSREGVEPTDATYGFDCLSDIYLVDVSVLPLAPVRLDTVTHDAAQLRPAIAGSKVVWEDFRNVSPDAENCPNENGCNYDSTPNTDIYGVDLSLTSNPVPSTLKRQHAASDARQSGPAVDSTTVGGVAQYLTLWEDYTDDWNRMAMPYPEEFGLDSLEIVSVNSNVFGALSVTSPSQVHRVAGLTTPWDRGRQSNISVHGKYMVWEDHRLGDGQTSDIWAFNLQSDKDGDSIPDFRETDLDGDGIPDADDSDIDGDADDSANTPPLSRCTAPFLVANIAGISDQVVASSSSDAVTVAGANWDGNYESNPIIEAKVMSGSIFGTEGGYFDVQVTSGDVVMKTQLIDHDNDTITVSPPWTTRPAPGSTISVFRRIQSSGGGDGMNAADFDCDGVHDLSDPNLDGDLFSDDIDIDDDNDGTLDDDDTKLGNPFQYSTLLSLGFSNFNGFKMDSAPRGLAEKNLTLSKTGKVFAANPDLYGTRMVYQADPGETGQTGVNDIWYVPNILSPAAQTRITNTTDNELNPAIYGDWIVYEDNSGANADIVAYNVIDKIRLNITPSSSDQKNPDIYKGRVVYEHYDGLTGLSDIYMTQLPKLLFSPSRLTVPYGTSASFRGSLKSASGSPVSGVTVSLKRGATVIGTATTTSTGSYIVGAKQYAASTYSLSFAGDKGFSPMISLPKTVKLSHYVTLVLSASSIKYGTYTKFTGKVAPNRAGKYVSLQKYSSTQKKWVIIKSLKLSSSSTYSYKAKYGKGSHKFRVYMPDEKQLGQVVCSRAYSPIKYLTVK